MGFFSDEELEKMRNSENAKADRERKARHEAFQAPRKAKEAEERRAMKKRMVTRQGFFGPVTKTAWEWKLLDKKKYMRD